MRILAVGDFQGVFPSKLKKKIGKEEFDLIVGVGDYGGIRDWKPWLHDFFRRIKYDKPIVSPNDFYGKENFKKLEKKDLNAAKKILRELNGMRKPIISVFGNSDNDWYSYPFEKDWPKRKKSVSKFLKGLKNFKDITYSQTRFQKELFVGQGGYMEAVVNFKKSKFNNKKRMKARMKRHLIARKNLLSRLKKIDRDYILVLHYPPVGVFDIIREKGNVAKGLSAGVDFYREAIRKHKPKFVLCGHMHEYQGMKKLHGVQIINPGDAEAGKAAIIEINGKDLKIKFIK